MRALLIVNPKATTTSARSRDVIHGALRSELELELGYTRRRGHAGHLAQQAAEAGIELVVALGGDGTVNEVVNGLMAGPPEKRPALAVVPGGSTNVFVRALGLPREWSEATGVLLQALREGRSRTIGLGLADDRYFTFCAGLGLDAAVTRRVERARRKGRRSTPGLYLRSTLGEYFLERHPAELTLELPGEPDEGRLASIIVQNTAPWTFLGDRPVHPNPDASFDLGLDVMALRVLRVPSTVRTVAQILATDGEPRGRQVLRHHDLAGFTVTSGTPQAFQLDGDYLGEREQVRFTAVPDALRVVC
ncbi:MAG: diacylglycerol kinase family lipid kinase [Hamadaea sp.]|uniref:diacylglycerol/lipid kinase family protein n=1 Tax=Hamadaea sp. TaxID=2024425 RepID=UPI001854B2D2|nr:diacylglycerol kinase family protein [Hamadaea sp.]NUT22651.1 diacylglycerol kinase family lipid kinase [Hamadaea sp.]